MTDFYGKYRGTVTRNDDPDSRGRVQVTVPAVFDDQHPGWAEACTPYAGDGVGLFAVPPVGAAVWVEFEGGDPDFPILAGCFWDEGQTAPGTGKPATKVLKSDGISLTLEDGSDGGLTIEVGSPAVAVSMKIACTSDGIELSIGSSKVLLSNSSVSINDGALEVT